MTRTDAFRAGLSIALVASLAGCNLLKKPEEAEQAKAPEGTEIVPLVAERDMPKDAAGQLVDKGEGPVLQRLDSLAGVDLGQRAGGCTFQHQDGRDLLVTAAAAAKGVPATGAVRAGGVIVYLKSVGDIGVDGLKAGPRLTGNGLTVEVAAAKAEKKGPITRARANLGVTDANGQQRLYSPGTWTCA